MTDTIFIPVPVSEKPEKDGYYIVIDPTNDPNRGRDLFFCEGDWFDDEYEAVANENHDDLDVDGCLWLNPISLQDLPEVKRLREENERLKANANETSYKR